MIRIRTRLAVGNFYYGWVVVAACFLVTGVVFGMTYSFGVYLDPLASTFTVSTAHTSLIFGAQLFVLYTAAAPMGGLVEWLAPRHGLVLAAALLGGGMIVGSLPVLVLTYSIVTGAGMSLAFVVGYATPPRWFQRRRGMATALASAGLGVGMVVIAPTASILVTRIGWRGAFPLLGGGLALVLLLTALLIADNPAHVDAAVDAEFPDGRPESDDGWRDQLRVVREAAMSRAFLLLFGGYVLMYVTLYVLLNHLVNYAAEQGIRKTGVLALSVIGGTTAVTRLAVGGVADRLGRLAVFVVCGAAMALALCVLPLASAPLVLLSIAVFFGVDYGGTGALLSSVLADLFGDRNLNTLFGLVSLSFAVPGLLGPFAAGFGFDRFGTYTPVFFTTGVVGLAGVGLVAGSAWLQGELGERS
ncbi:MFS transporter [Haladaptatus halobius]|uniref:MFS transporter n=1 Tax=Haladaptatus halobius TaxID=2884875 RepID=UPI001D0B430C|nr:MFS transporter [Haladaptatus halobius]